jgi:acylphosphatase
MTEDERTLETVQLVVHGKVQGVGFRFFVSNTADRLGVLGWTRNLSDGSVEVLAHANRQTLDEFTEAVKIGPPGSKVERLVVTTKEAPTEIGEGFLILHS